MAKRRRIVLETSEEDQRTPIQIMASMLGRLGGLKGGPARMAKLTPEERSALAQKAGRSSWKRERELGLLKTWDPEEDEALQRRAAELLRPDRQ